jgi:TM2 domain-containing membrane protein YozV
MTIEPYQHARQPVPVAPAVPAGWYPDSTMAATLRYWDGRSWTQHTAPMVGGPLQVTVVHVAPRRSMGAAYLLLIFLGAFGAHRFYLGRTGSAIAQLLLWIFGWATSFVFVGLPLLAVVVVWNIVDLFLTAGMVHEENARA